MADSFHLTVDDTSPTVSYFPLGDTFSTPNLSAGWNPYYTLSGFAPAPGQTGNGESMHITSLDGASLSMTFYGTGIQVFGNCTGQASYNVSLDGTQHPISPNNTVLAAFDNLTNTNHTISLTASTFDSSDDGSSFVAFDKAIVTTAPPSSTDPSNYTTQSISDANIAFHGQWSYQSSASGSIPMHVSTTAGDRVHTLFQGTGLTLTGLTSPDSGAFTVTLDNKTTHNLSAQSSFALPNTLLFYASGLSDDSTHTLEVVNRDGSMLAIDAGGFNITTDASTSQNPNPPPSQSSSLSTSSTYPRGTIAALVLSGVMILVVIGALIYFLAIYRPRRRRQRAERRVQRQERRLQMQKLEGLGEGAGQGGVDIIDIRPRQLDEVREDDDDDAEDTIAEHDIAPAASGSRTRGYKFGYGLPPHLKGNDDEKASLDFNLDPSLYREDGPTSSKKNTAMSRASSKKDRMVAYVSENMPSLIPLPSIFRSSRSSHTPPHSRTHSRTHSASTSSSDTAPTQDRPPSPQSLTAPPSFPGRSSRSSYYNHGHARDGSRGFLLRSSRDSDHGSPVSPDDDQTAGIELALGPRISNSPALVMPQHQEVAALHAGPRPMSLTTFGPRVSFGPRPKPTSPPHDRRSMDNIADHFRGSSHPPDVPASARPSEESVKPVLDVRSTSPFEVEFDPGSRRVSKDTKRSSKRKSQQVQFDLGDLESQTRRRESGRDVVEKTSAKREHESQPTTSATADNLLSPPSRTLSVRKESSLSFLDLSSPPASLRNGNSSTSGSSSQASQHSRDPPLRSRWSTTTLSAPTVSSQSQYAETASFSDLQGVAPFPFPVSLPPSPHHPPGTSTSHPYSRGEGLAYSHSTTASHARTNSEGLDSIPLSPTDSIPMSVSSEMQFRSNSNTGSLVDYSTTSGSHLPRHPPLPDSPTIAAPARAAPSKAQRMLGMAGSDSAWSAPSGSNVPPLDRPGDLR